MCVCKEEESWKLSGVTGTFEFLFLFYFEHETYVLYRAEYRSRPLKQSTVNGKSREYDATFEANTIKKKKRRSKRDCRICIWLWNLLAQKMQRAPDKSSETELRTDVLRDEHSRGGLECVGP